MIYSKKKMEEIVGEITKLVAEYSEYPKVKKGVNIESTDKIILDGIKTKRARVKVRKYDKKKEWQLSFQIFILKYIINIL